MDEYQITTGQKIKLFCLKATIPTIKVLGTGLVGFLLYAGFTSNKEAQVEESFRNTQAFTELDSTYKAQCTAIDTPYVRQRIAIEKAYHFKKDSLKQVYVDSVKLSGGK